MELSVFSSDSDDSDLEVLAQLSDWDTDNSDAADAEVRQRASSRRIRRVNYMQTDCVYNFTYKFSTIFFASSLPRDSRMSKFQSVNLNVPFQLKNIATYNNIALITTSASF